MTDQRTKRIADASKSRLRLLRRRPEPPRGVKFQDGYVQWEPPRETANVTHYNIYRNTENELLMRVPEGQTFAKGVSGARAFVSSYNELSELESEKMLLDQALNGDGGRRVTVVMDGVVGIESNVAGKFYLPMDATTYTIYTECKVGPLGSDLVIVLNKNGSPLFTFTTASGSVVSNTITGGAQILSTDELVVDVTAVGSSFPCERPTLYIVL